MSQRTANCLFKTPKVIRQELKRSLSHNQYHSKPSFIVSNTLDQFSRSRLKKSHDMKLKNWYSVRLSTSCVLAGKPQKHDIFSSCGGLRVLSAACVFLRRKNFLRHFLRVHYFWAVLYSFMWMQIQFAISFKIKGETFLYYRQSLNTCTRKMLQILLWHPECNITPLSSALSGSIFKIHTWYCRSFLFGAFVMLGFFSVRESWINTNINYVLLLYCRYDRRKEVERKKENGRKRQNKNYYRWFQVVN